MTFKEQLAADVATFLSLTEFAETITYNSATCAAVMEIGELSKGNFYQSDGTSETAILHIAATTVNAPASRDVVVHSSKTWYVSRVLASDEYMHRLELTASEGRW